MDLSCHRECRFCIGWHSYNHNKTREVDHWWLISCFFLPVLLKRNQTISKDGSEMNERVRIVEPGIDKLIVLYDVVPTKRVDRSPQWMRAAES